MPFLVSLITIAAWAVGSCFTRATGTNPVIDFRQFETKETANLMRGKTLVVYPAINGVLVDVEMRSHIIDADPSFFSSHFNPSSPVVGRMSMKTDESRL